MKDRKSRKRLNFVALPKEGNSKCRKGWLRDNRGELQGPKDRSGFGKLPFSHNLTVKGTVQVHFLSHPIAHVPSGGIVRSKGSGGINKGCKCYATAHT